MKLRELKDVLDLLCTEQTSVFVDTEPDKHTRAYFIDAFDKDAVTEYLDYPVAGIDVYNDGSVIINLGDKND